MNKQRSTTVIMKKVLIVKKLTHLRKTKNKKKKKKMECVHCTDDRRAIVQAKEKCDKPYLVMSTT